MAAKAEDSNREFLRFLDIQDLPESDRDAIERLLYTDVPRESANEFPFENKPLSWTVSPLDKKSHRHSDSSIGDDGSSGVREEPSPEEFDDREEDDRDQPASTAARDKRAPATYSNAKREHTASEAMASGTVRPRGFSSMSNDSRLRRMQPQDASSYSSGVTAYNGASGPLSYPLPQHDAAAVTGAPAFVQQAQFPSVPMATGSVMQSPVFYTPAGYVQNYPGAPYFAFISPHHPMLASSVAQQQCYQAAFQPSTAAAPPMRPFANGIATASRHHSQPPQHQVAYPSRVPPPDALSRDDSGDAVDDDEEAGPEITLHVRKSPPVSTSVRPPDEKRTETESVKDTAVEEAKSAESTSSPAADTPSSTSANEAQFNNASAKPLHVELPDSPASTDEAKKIAITSEPTATTRASSEPLSLVSPTVVAISPSTQADAPSPAAATSKTKSYASLFSKEKAGLVVTRFDVAVPTAGGEGVESAQQVALAYNGAVDSEEAIRRGVEASLVEAQKKERATDVSELPTEKDPEARRIAERSKQVLAEGFQNRGARFPMRGLTNCGNWCYVNATLQALIACPSLFHFLQSLVDVTNRSPTSTPVLDAFVSFFSEYYSAARFHNTSQCNRISSGGVNPREIEVGHSFEARRIHHVLNLLKSEDDAQPLQYGHQEDAEEFLLACLNKMHEELSACTTFATGGTGATTSAAKTVNGVDANAEAAGGEWLQVGHGRRSLPTREAKLGDSPVSQIFSGKMRYSVQPTAGNSRESVTLQSFFTLPLEIQPQDINSVETAISYYMRPETVKVTNPNAKSKVEVDATRRCSFDELPHVLILQLKHFLYEDGGLKKLIKQIRFNVRLDIRPEWLSASGFKKTGGLHARNYKLFAIVYHHGEKAADGHYTAAIFHAGCWVMMDDTHATPLTSDELLSRYEPPRVPYLLFYRRMDGLVSTTDYVSRGSEGRYYQQREQ